jgi:SPW repeat
LFGFADLGGRAAWITRIVGLMVLLQALSTDYELSAMKIISIGMHLMTDYVVGAFLIASPWLFGFSAVRMPTLTLTVVGLLILGLTTMTQPAGRPRKIMA